MLIINKLLLKLQVKEEKKIRRAQKKQTKIAFQTEAGKITTRISKVKQTTDQVSVFKY
jgi:hypothetical protein